MKTSHMREELNPQLEALIDTHDLPTVICSLADICREKAEHLRTNWQDKVMAKEWDKQAANLDKAYMAVLKTYNGGSR